MAVESRLRSRLRQHLTVGPVLRASSDIGQQQGGLQVVVEHLPVPELLHQRLIQTRRLLGLVLPGGGQARPLHHRRLRDGGGRVGVELQQLRSVGGVGEVEPAVEVPLAVIAPGLAHQLPEALRNIQQTEEIVGQPLRNGFHEQVVQLIGGRKQGIGLVLGQAHRLPRQVVGAAFLHHPLPAQSLQDLVYVA